MKTFLKITSAAGLLIGTALSTPKADAATLLNPVIHYAKTSTDILAALEVPKFDLSLGTLLSVQITVLASADTQITVQNDGTPDEFGRSDSDGDVQTSITYYLADPSHVLSGDPLGAIYVPDTPQSYTLAANESETLAKESVDGLILADNIYNNASNPGILSEFAGSGNLTLTLTTFTQTVLGNDGGNTSASEITNAGADVTVVYTYEPIPEPSTWAMLAGGLGVLILASFFAARLSEPLDKSLRAIRERWSPKRRLCSEILI
jgi:hypothetical protein